MTNEVLLDDTDRRIVLATQSGLPLEPQPYHAVARQVGVSPEEVMTRMRRMLETGIIRRIGVVPNHYALGYKANGMTVWNVPDDKVDELGERVGALDFVSHCYQRPRHLPDWPYNFFAMVHGHDHGEVEAQVRRIVELLGDFDRGHEILYSTRILKKTGLRIGG
ncbi:MAG: AsnC family transcriptional regulator [Betaproteobacteria bacterium]